MRQDIYVADCCSSCDIELQEMQEEQEEREYYTSFLESFPQYKQEDNTMSMQARMEAHLQALKTLEQELVAFENCMDREYHFIPDQNLATAASSARMVGTWLRDVQFYVQKVIDFEG